MSKIKKGFTLIELLVVVVIIGILAAIVVSNTAAFKERAYMSAAKRDFGAMTTAINLYLSDHSDYPPDANRNVPVGLEPYLDRVTLDRRPDTPWPGGVYDRDNMLPASITYAPKEHFIQLSIRFCPLNSNLSQCRFPQTTWASGFNIDSSAYFCIGGPCRSHPSQPVEYPGYCINCNQ